MAHRNLLLNIKHPQFYQYQRLSLSGDLIRRIATTIHMSKLICPRITHTKYKLNNLNGEKGERETECESEIVSEKERETEREKERETEREKERETERERERQSERKSARR